MIVAGTLTNKMAPALRKVCTVCCCHSNCVNSPFHYVPWIHLRVGLVSPIYVKFEWNEYDRISWSANLTSYLFIRRSHNSGSTASTVEPRLSEPQLTDYSDYPALDSFPN